MNGDIQVNSRGKRLQGIIYFFRAFRKFLSSFILISLAVYTLMYLVPGMTKFEPGLPWPLSYLNWLWNLFTLKFNYQEIFSRYLRTIILVFGSLGLSFLIVTFFLFLKYYLNSGLTNIIQVIINLTSGFHVLVLGILYYLLTHKTGYSLGVFFILAFGSGSLAEMYNTLDSEIEKIFKKEYVVAGTAWGMSYFCFPRRELFITLIEQLIARLPMMFGSTIIIEMLFNIKGLSYTIYNSIIKKDFETIIMSTILISATIILFNVIAEKTRQQLDPRSSNEMDYTR